jgi:hypothetical protein
MNFLEMEEFDAAISSNDFDGITNILKKDNIRIIKYGDRLIAAFCFLQSRVIFIHKRIKDSQSMIMVLLHELGHIVTTKHTELEANQFASSALKLDIVCYEQKVSQVIAQYGLKRSEQLDYNDKLTLPSYFQDILEMEADQ